MKKRILLFTSLAAVCLACFSGCDNGGAKAAPIDTSAVTAAFSTATPADKSEIEKIITSIKASDYPTALASLKAAADKLKLTPEQQQAVKDLIAQIQSKLGADAEALEKAKAAAESAKQVLTATNKPAGSK